MLIIAAMTQAMPAIYDALDGLSTYRVTALEAKLGCDVVAYFGPILGGAELLFRAAVESLRETPGKRKPRIAVVLNTEGGIVEVVERMVTVVRHHYDEVQFYIPDIAMSAGTVFALSGDSVHMDYFSVLGPIDPQVEKEGRLIPALGYLLEYERILAACDAGKATDGDLILLGSKFDVGEMAYFKEARNLSVTLLKKWLAAYKFKNWSTTETSKRAISHTEREQRAEEIAGALTDPKRWHSHGRGIHMKVLRDELKLRIDDFDDDPELASLLREYFRTMEEMQRLQGKTVLVHTRNYP